MLSISIGITLSLVWDHNIVLPIKLLVVYVHELGHGITAMASGAYLEKINLNSLEWGETLVKNLRPGPGYFMTVSSGYLGCIIAGTILFNRGLRGELERFTLGIFLALLLYTGFLFTEPGSISFFTSIGWSFFLMCTLVLGRTASRICILFLGVFFIWYCFFDLFDFTKDVMQTDAGILAQYIFDQQYWKSYDGTEESMAKMISMVWTVCIILIVVIGVAPLLKSEEKIGDDMQVDANPQLNDNNHDQSNVDLTEGKLIGLDERAL